MQDQPTQVSVPVSRAIIAERRLMHVRGLAKSTPFGHLGSVRKLSAPVRRRHVAARPCRVRSSGRPPTARGFSSVDR